MKRIVIDKSIAGNDQRNVNLHAAAPAPQAELSQRIWTPGMGDEPPVTGTNSSTQVATPEWPCFEDWDGAPIMCKHEKCRTKGLVEAAAPAETAGRQHVPTCSFKGEDAPCHCGETAGPQVRDGLEPITPAKENFAMATGEASTSHPDSFLRETVGEMTPEQFAQQMVDCIGNLPRGMHDAQLAAFFTERLTAYAEYWKSSSDQFEKLFEDAKRERDALVREIVYMTPGGSEFVGDAKRCLAFIQDRMASVVTQVKARQAAELKLEKMREALCNIGNIIGRPVMHYAPSSAMKEFGGIRKEIFAIIAQVLGE